MIKRSVVFLAALILALPQLGWAGVPSSIGAKPMPKAMGHSVSVGWPSLGYEWWNRGNPDWALGAEMVYGDWSGEFSDVDVALGVNVPLRWHLTSRGRADVALRWTPGVLMGDTQGGGNQFLFGVRSELAVPVTVNLHSKVNLVTGGTVPASVFFVESGDPYMVLPFMGRIGVEVTASQSVVPWILFEIGPAFAFGDIGPETKAAFRAMLGVTFW